MIQCPSCKFSFAPDLKSCPVCGLRSSAVIVSHARAPRQQAPSTGNDWPFDELLAANRSEALSVPAAGDNVLAELYAATPTVWVTPTIVGINVLVFFLMVVRGAGFFSPDAGSVLSWGADFWPMTTGGEWWRLLASSFLHFGIIHLAFNMWALIGAGPLTERLYGRGFFAAVYLAGGIFASLASMWLNHTDVSAGASGAIFAVYGMLVAYLLTRSGALPWHELRPLLKSTIGFIGYNLAYGFAHPMTDNYAHLGGLGAGLVLGPICARPLEPNRRLRQTTPRAIGGAALAAVAMGFAFIIIPKCSWLSKEREFLRVRESVAAAEDQFIGDYNQIMEDAKNSKITEAVMVRRLNERVLPTLNRVSSELMQCCLAPESPSRKLEDTLIQYFDLRRAAVLCVIESINAQNGYNLGRIQELNKRIEAASKEVTDAAAQAWAEPGAPTSPPSVNVPTAPATEPGRGHGSAPGANSDADYSQSMAIYRKAADAGDVKAMETLGDMYVGGEGVTKDSIEAIKWYCKAADAGYAEAMYKLGCLYTNGDGVHQDFTEAMKWYRRAADEGVTGAMNNIGVLYRGGAGVFQDYREAMIWLRKAADAGITEAMINLGGLYDDGRGVARDPAEAMKWYLKAAEAGDAKAMYNVGYLHATGDGVLQDFAEAMNWYRKAADAGVSDAMSNIGIFYERGQGVSQDYAEAMKWYRKAADAGNALAMHNIGGLYVKGFGVLQNSAEAMKWFRKAADAGNTEAMAGIGYLVPVRRTFQLPTSLANE